MFSLLVFFMVVGSIIIIFWVTYQKYLNSKPKFIMIIIATCCLFFHTYVTNISIAQCSEISRLLNNNETDDTNDGSQSSEGDDMTRSGI